MKTQSIESNLRFAHRALTNGSQSPTIREVLADYGYDEQRFPLAAKGLPTARQEGFALYNKANRLYIDQKKEYSDQYSATRALNDIYEEASDVYMKHVMLARINCVKILTFTTV